MLRFVASFFFVCLPSTVFGGVFQGSAALKMGRQVRMTRGKWVFFRASFLGFTGFHRVLWGPVGYWWVLLGLCGFDSMAFLNGAKYSAERPQLAATTATTTTTTTTTKKNNKTDSNDGAEKAMTFTAESALGTTQSGKKKVKVRARPRRKPIVRPSVHPSIDLLFTVSLLLDLVASLVLTRTR